MAQNHNFSIHLGSDGFAAREPRAGQGYRFWLPQIGRPAVIEPLKPENLKDVLALQDATRAALPDAQKMFVLPQTQGYFEKLLAQENGMMIGAWESGQLVAQMALMGEISLAEADESHLITRNDVSFHHAAPSDRVVLLKSMSVHSDWRGNDLAQHLIRYAATTPLARRADHLFAQVSAENVRSWDLFLQQGFGVVAAALDPVDNKPRFILQKPALGFDLHDLPSEDDINPVIHFAAVMRLTQHEALIGRPNRGEAFTLAFYAGADTAATWYDAPSHDLPNRSA